MTHDQLQEDLAKHLRGGTDRMVWTNTQLGPVGSPRPDVFTVNKSFSRFRTDCYEIKISVSDLRRDVTSGKWQSYRKFGMAVWFAFPKGMAPLDIIPRECGVICRSDAGWRAARKPVAQVLDTLPRDTWLKLLMQPCVTDSAEPYKPSRDASHYRAETIVRQKMGAEIGRLFADVQSAQANLEYRRAGLQAELDAITAQKVRHGELMAADAVRLQGSLDKGLLQLGATLGVKPEECTAAALCQAIAAFRTQLNGRRIDEAIKLLTGLREAMPANDATSRWDNFS